MSSRASGRVYSSSQDTVLLDLTDLNDAEESKRALGAFHSLLGMYKKTKGGGESGSFFVYLLFFFLFFFFSQPILPYEICLY